MPTYETSNAGGTPQTRVTSLLTSALAALDPTCPAYPTLREAHKLSAGQESYLEEMTGDLVVPKTHAVPKEHVQKAFVDLLRKTETTDWKALKAQGKTQWELSVGMCSGAYEAVVLQQLALLLKPVSVLEIGVFTGTATLALALLPSVKHITALDIEEILPSFVRPAWDAAGVSSKIDFRISPALDSLDKLVSEGHDGFDLVFIDADKPGYKPYVQKILEGGLLRQGGVILADNTLYKGYPWSPPDDASTYSTSTGTNNQSKKEAAQGIHSFNEFVRQSEELECAILPIRDGISIIRRTI